MILSWSLNSKTGMCEWAFQNPECQFQAVQPIDEFFSLVDNLHTACGELRQMMADGLDPKAAIAEWERMIKGSDASISAEVAQSGEEPTLVLLESTNRQTLLDFLKDKLGERIKEFDGREGKVLIHLTMKPCQSVIDFKTLDDVPVKSVPCPCGNPKHWMIRYEEEG